MNALAAGRPVRKLDAALTAKVRGTMWGDDARSGLK
jgi:hypothetical protein